MPRAFMPPAFRRREGSVPQESVEMFAEGDQVEFNERGRSAQVNLPAPNGSSWTVSRIIPQTKLNAPHPQLLDLGPGYPIGPVSGMFVTKRKENGS
jgi:hypothetical protein